MGFGSYRSHTGDLPLAGFSPRKQHLVLHLVGGYEERHPTSLARLGPRRTGKGCLYLKRLDDADEGTLREFLQRAIRVHKGADRSHQPE